MLSTIFFSYGGYPFLKILVDELRANTIGMMTIIWQSHSPQNVSKSLVRGRLKYY